MMLQKNEIPLRRFTHDEWYETYVCLCHGDLGTQEQHDTTTSFCCQGMSKTGSVLDIWVLAELQWIYEGSLKGNMSWLND